MRLSSVFLFFMWLSASASADVFDYPVEKNAATADALARLSQELAKQENIRGDFVQEKFLSILDKPLLSSGSFTLSRSHNFVWQVEEPFAVSYRFADRSLHRQDVSGEHLVKPSEDPMLYGFFAFFSTLFDMSQSDLEKLFHVYFQQQGQQWVLGLQPKDTGLRKAVASIVVEGQRLPNSGGVAPDSGIAITKVTIRESGGDYSHLQFSYR